MPETTALLADAIYRKHLEGRQHPEKPDRFDAVMGGLESAGLMGRLLRISPRPATEEELLL